MRCRLVWMRCSLALPSSNFIEKEIFVFFVQELAPFSDGPLWTHEREQSPMFGPGSRQLRHRFLQAEPARLLQTQVAKATRTEASQTEILQTHPARLLQTQVGIAIRTGSSDTDSYIQSQPDCYRHR
jgi:hypothetical protein